MMIGVSAFVLLAWLYDLFVDAGGMSDSSNESLNTENDLAGDNTPDSAPIPLSEIGDDMPDNTDQGRDSGTPGDAPPSDAPSTPTPAPTDNTPPPAPPAPSPAPAPAPAPALDNVFFGTEGNDTMPGTDAGETFFGLASFDEINAGAGDDLLSGDTRPDVMNGGAGDDLINSGFDLTNLAARIQSGAAPLPAGLAPGTADAPAFAAALLRELGTGATIETNVDTVTGGAGDDSFFLGLGDDATGGDGADSFFLPVSDNSIDDRLPVTVIRDFNPAEDTVLLYSALLSQTQIGTLENIDPHNLGFSRVSSTELLLNYDAGDGLVPVVRILSDQPIDPRNISMTLLDENLLQQSNIRPAS